MELLATTLIFGGAFGFLFWYIHRVDGQMTARMSVEERVRAGEAQRRFMRRFWRVQALFAAFMAAMLGVVVVAFVRQGYWQVALVALPFLPLVIWGVVWAGRGGDIDDDE
jgi:hypothetical protein